MAIRAVFFDLGGTLLIMRRDRIFRKVLQEQGRLASVDQVHTAYIKSESWWLATYGGRVMSPEETNEAYRDLDTKVFFALFPESTASEAELVSKIARSRWPELQKEVPLELYPDAEPLLSSLAAEGFSLGLVSNAPPDTRNAVRALGIEKFMTNIVISGLVGFTKPNPEIFKIALRNAGVAAVETVHVGDLYDADIVGARNAGIKGILLDRDGSQRSANCPRIQTLSELPSYLH